MDFENETGFPADISRTQLFYKDLLMAIVVLKATFRVEADATVTPDPDPIPLSEADEETPWGVMDGDYAPIKEKSDLVVFGQAYAPEGRPIEEMTVELRMAGFHNSLLVFGDRVWTGDRKMSPPQPFITMPIIYANAYGGDARQVKDYEIQGGYASNPVGKGYVEVLEHVEDTALPNIEDPQDRIQSWENQPQPAGFAPMHRASTLRGLRGTRVDLEKKQTMLEPMFFNSAHPKMMLDELPLGTELSLLGMTPEGDWQFELPRFHIAIEVRLGEAETRMLMRPDTLCLLPEERRLFLIFRRAMVYPFIPEQKRLIHLSQVDDHTAQEIKAIVPKTLREAAADPNDRIELASPIEDSFQLPVSHEQMMQYYPLTEIIHGLPVCNGCWERTA